MRKRLSICLSTLLTFNMISYTTLKAYAEEITQSITEEITNEQNDLSEDIKPVSESEKNLTENDFEEKINDNNPVLETEETETNELDDFIVSEENNVTNMLYIDHEFNYDDNGDGTASITKYVGSSTDIIIPETIEGLNVIEISKDAFSQKGITSVVLPSSIKKIGEAAFYENNITTLILPEGLEYIGPSSFYNNSISSLTIPTSLDVIEDFAFQNNELTEVLIPDGINLIGIKAFADNNITSFTINGDVKELGKVSGGWILDNGPPSTGHNKADLIINGNIETIHDFAFRDDVLNSILIKGNIGRIGQFAFESNNPSEGLQTVDIQGNIGSVGLFAFRDNKRLNSFQINGNINAIEGYAFRGSEIEDFKILGTVNSIGEWSFGNSKIKNLLIDGPVKIIDQYSLNQMESDTIKINGDIDEIGYYAAANSKIKELVVNGSIGTLGEYSLYLLESNTIQVAGDIGNMGQFSIQEVNIGDFFVKGSINKVSSYVSQRAAIKNFLVEKNINEIDEYAFQLNTIRNFTVNQDVNTIGQYAFQVSDMDNVSFKGNINEIGLYAFQHGNYGNIFIEGNVENISEGAFQESIINSITVNGTIKKIGKYAFLGRTDGTDHIRSIHILGDVDFIEEYAFLQLNMSEGILINGNVERIGEGAFLHSTINSINIKGNVGIIGQFAFAFYKDKYAPWIKGISEIVIDGRVNSTQAKSFEKVSNNKVLIKEGIENIGEGTFMFISPKEFDALKNTKTIGKSSFQSAELPNELIIPDSVMNIASEAFQNATANNLVINSQATTIDTNSFHSFKTVKDLKIPNNVLKIDSYAFTEVGMEKLKLSSKLESIKEGAFANHKLACVTIPSTVTSIEKDAFKTTDKTNFVMWGDKGSAAETYATKEGFTFKENDVFSNDCNPADWSIEVQYLDEDGQLLDSKTISKPDLGSHTVKAKDISGYTLIGDATLQVDITKKNPNHTITFVYQKNSTSPIPVTGNLTVIYIDEDGNTLDTKFLNNLPMGTHTEQAKLIKGYEVLGQAQQRIEITKDNTQFNITFTYKKKKTEVVTPEPTDPSPITVPETQEPTPENKDTISENGETTVQEPEKPNSPNDKPEDEHKWKRVIRDEGNGVFTTVPHYVNNTEDLKITTKYDYGLIFTDRVEAPFNDIDGVFSYQEIEDLYNYLIVNGTTPSTYSPNQNITRGQFSAMIARALELRTSSSKYQFTDVSWYKNEVQALYEAGIVTGFPDGTFGERKPLSRQQAAAMIVRMLTYMGVEIKPSEIITLVDMNDISDYAKEAVQFLATQDVLISGQDTYFNPFNNLTRAQMAKILMRSLRISDWY